MTNNISPDEGTCYIGLAPSQADLLELGLADTKVIVSEVGHVTRQRHSLIAKLTGKSVKLVL